MPRKRVRTENKGLPARWRFRHGAYYFDVPVSLRDAWDGKREFRLGKTLPEAYRIWAQRLDHQPVLHTIAQLHRAPDGLRMGELSAATLTSNGNVTSLVASLEAEALTEHACGGHRLEVGERERRHAAHQVLR